MRNENQQRQRLLLFLLIEIGMIKKAQLCILEIQ